MNIFRTIFELRRDASSPSAFERDFGPTYGNRIAAETALRERWQPRRVAPRSSVTRVASAVPEAAGCA